MMLRSMVGLALVLLTVFWGACAQARTFTPVGTGNGLEARVVPSLVFGSKGFLWVGSREGLYRYDGYQAQAFLPEMGNPESISDIDIRALFEAADGSIWVGTATGGLDRFDPVSEKFSNYSHEETEPASLPDNTVNAITQDSDGSLWVATSRGLSRLDPATGRFEQFLNQKEDGESVFANPVLTLHSGDSGRLWAGTAGDGIHLWNPDRRGFTRFDLAELTAGPAARNQVLAISEDENAIVWCGTRAGLVRLDPRSGRVQAVELGTQAGEAPEITALWTEGVEPLWLTTRGGDVVIVNRENGEWHHALSDSELAAIDYPRDPKVSLAVGSEQVFVGTWGRGVYRTPLREGAFDLFNMSNTEGLSNNVVTAVLATDEVGFPWIGSLGGGPQWVDLAGRRILAKPVRRHRLRESGVLSLAGPIDGRFYAGTSHGLYEFTADATQVALFAYDPGNPGGIGDGHVLSLLSEGESGLWLGMGGSGLYFFDSRSQRFSSFRHDPKAPDSISGDFVTALLDDGKGRIWVGTRSNGLNRCQKENWSCERFGAGGEGLAGLSDASVTSLFRDRRGRVWVGTDGGGLNLVLQNENGRVTGFTHWCSEEGLLSDAVMAIEEDLDESLWLSSRQGLARLNPASGQIINFVAASGLPVTHFNAGAASSDERNVYFGSTGGLIAIPKGSLLAEHNPPPVRVTASRQAADGTVWQLRWPEDGSLNLSHGDVLSVELAILDFAESKSEYAYRLSPFDPWTELGTQRKIVFQGLAPAHYELQARARDAYGTWGETEPLPLVIVPPYWSTSWFQGLIAIAILALVLAIHFAREATLKRRSDELLRLGEKREQALEEKLGSEAELAVLTPRQKEILQLLAEGYSAREIADLLGVSAKTVAAHRANLMERLEIHDLPGLVRLAIRSGLVSMED